MEQATLFKEHPLRRSNGRYCTQEQYRQEKVYSENKMLRFERDRYFRMWLTASNKASRLERKLTELKKKIGELI